MVQLLGKRKLGSSTLSLCALIASGLNLLSFLFIAFQGLTLNQMSLRKPPALVQVSDSQSIQVTDELERNSETIKNFVQSIMTSLFTWSGTLPPQTIEEAKNPNSDPGVAIKIANATTKKVATTTWVASFAISDQGFRQSFLQTVAQLTPPEIFSRNSKAAIASQLYIRNLSNSEKIESGKWKIVMVADIIFYHPATNRKKLVPLNKEILVRAVDTPEHPLPSLVSPLQQAIYSTRKMELEIYEIRDLCLTDKTDKSIDCPLDRNP